MKKLFTLSYFVFLISYSLFSQSVGIGTNTPNPSAQLDVTATNKGLLIPRMNTAAISAISTPAKGLMVLDTARNQLMFNIGTPAAPNWQTISFNSGWSTTGNAGTSAATNFIGTTDAVDVIVKRGNVQSGLINSTLLNTSWGYAALNPLTTGSANVAIGTGVLGSNTEGAGNTACGHYALRYNTSGSQNTGNGYLSLSNNTSGVSNSAYGSGSLYANTSGSANTAVGEHALFSDTSGSNNTATGYNSILANITGSNNSAYGFGTLSANTSGENNTAVGVNAGADNATGSNNVFLGASAGQHETGSDRLYISNNDADANNALIYGEFNNKMLRTNGRVEINSDNTLIDGLSVIKNYNAGANKNVRAVYGENIIDNGWGIGVQGKGGNTGVLGQSTGTAGLAYTGVKGISDGINTGFNYGIIGQASGSELENRAITGEATGTTGDKYGLYGYASGGGGTNMGIYAKAIDGITNFAGWFEGDVKTNNGKLTIATAAGATGLDLSTSDAYAEMRVIRNTLNATDKNLYLGFGSPVNSSIHLYSDGLETVTIKDNITGVGKTPTFNSNYGKLQVKQTASLNAITMEATGNANHWDFSVPTVANADLLLFYNGVVKGAFSNTTGDYITNSDRRLKKDITPLANVLDNVMQLQAYQYHYLDNQPADRLSNGFMAQDVQKLFPDAVVENTMKDGQTRLGINYQYFTVLAIKGLQEQQQQIQSQEERIGKLEAMVKTLAEKK